LKPFQFDKYLTGRERNHAANKPGPSPDFQELSETELQEKMAGKLRNRSIRVVLNLTQDNYNKSMVIGPIIAFLLALVVNVVSSLLVKTQVNKVVPIAQRLSWWALCDQEVATKHREINPGSPLPKIEHYSFYISLFLFAVVIVASIAASSTN